MRKNPERLEIDMAELDALLARVKEALGEEDEKKLRQTIETLEYLLHLVESKGTTINRLRQILFGSSTEKTRDVLGDEAEAEEKVKDQKQASETKRKGHGRLGAKAYTGADKIEVAHESLAPGDPCPKCDKGKLYKQREPGVLVRIVGQAPLAATVFELEKLRCGLCGEVFTARAPQEVERAKYSETAAAMIALLKYGSGLPFNRLQGLQGNLGVPLPASTQWDIAQDLAQWITPAYGELIRQAAQGQVVYNDDTTAKILELMGKRRNHEAFADELPDRSGMYTSGIVSSLEGRRIALFFTSTKHAGENLETVLANRASELGAPIQMCDALSRNMSGEFESILANCLAHGRRRFVEVVNSFPSECRHVLEVLRDVYKNDALTAKEQMSLEERLAFHQANSKSLMDELHAWMTQQLEEKLVEPNSGLGTAIAYMQKHWQKLTLFLSVPGAPLDNNLCERALKKAIIHRKNSLFFKTLNGAHVGDVLMSLIHTCELCSANPFDYLTELRKHPNELASNPEEWMPWNYPARLAVYT